jgi:hypothetical protein
VIKATASRGPEVGNTYPLLKAPGHVGPKAWALPRVEDEGETGRQVVKSWLLMPIVEWEKSKDVDRSCD